MIDASSDARLVPLLVALGHDATLIGLDYPASLSDAAIVAIAISQRRIVFTDDRAFGEMVARQGLPLPGLVLFRLAGQTWSVRRRRLDDLLRLYPGLAGLFAVVTPRSIRTRPLVSP